MRNHNHLRTLIQLSPTKTVIVATKVPKRMPPISWWHPPLSSNCVWSLQLRQRGCKSLGLKFRLPGFSRVLYDDAASAPTVLTNLSSAPHINTIRKNLCRTHDSKKDILILYTFRVCVNAAIDPALVNQRYVRIMCSSAILRDTKNRSLNSLWGSGIFFAIGYTNYINGECLRNR